MSEGTGASQQDGGTQLERSLPRPGLTSITPYISAARGAVHGVPESAFEGVERMRMPAPNGSIITRKCNRQRRD